MSGVRDEVEFERQVGRPLPDEFRRAVSGLAAGELIDAIRADTAAINALEARRLAQVSELYARREEEHAARAEGDRPGRFIDDWDLLSAEVGAAFGATRGMAAGRIHQAVELRERLPEVFALCARGAATMAQAVASIRAAAAIVDDDICLEFDRRLAKFLRNRAAQGHKVMSPRAIQAAAGRILAQLDPDAAAEDPRPKPTPRIAFDGCSNGFVAVDVLMSRVDAIRLSDLIDAAAETVCRKDGRGLNERRTAALIALVCGYATLGCECGTAECEWAERRPRTGAAAKDPKALAVVVLSEADYAAAQPREAQPREAQPREARPGAGESGGYAVVVTGNPDLSGPIPVSQVRDLLGGCEVRVTSLGRRDEITGEVHATGSSGYRPTEYQILVMRMRYPTCVFPHCTVSSSRCQADHVSEFDHLDPARGGPTTVPGRNTGNGNLVPLCSFHHMIKTESGWLSDILEGGSVEWRHPAGGVWVVDPGTEVLPGMDRIIWDVRSAPRPSAARTDDGLSAHAQQRNAERRRLRAYYGGLRSAKQD